MKTEIDVYKSFRIYFDTNEQKFCCYSNIFDNEGTSKSYAGMLTYINKYIKVNHKFPQTKAVLNTGNIKVVTLTGVRKDGLFSCEKEGEMGSISKYEQQMLYSYKVEYDKYLDLVKKHSQEREALWGKHKSIEKVFVEKHGLFPKDEYKQVLLLKEGFTWDD